MKKAVNLLLILSLCLGLCACGGPRIIEKEVEVPVVPEEWYKYREIFRALDTENYDEAWKLVEDWMDADKKTAVREVTITTENFLDYFEYVEFPEYELDIEKDSAGNPKKLYFRSGYCLKEGYIAPMEKLEDSELHVTARYDRLIFRNNEGIDVDLENRTYTITGEPSYSESLERSLPLYSRTIFDLGDPSPDYPFFEQCYYYVYVDSTILSGIADDSSAVITFPEIVSASGTLYLYE